MTVYVDNFHCPARVGRIKARWSHLTADTREELRDFAALLGLDPAWFQGRCKYGGCDPCPHWHYDVTDRLREKAIKLGAKPVDIREFGAIVTARRRSETAQGAGPSTLPGVTPDPFGSPSGEVG